MNSISLSFLAYSLIVLGFGIYTARFARDSSADFFLAGRSLGPWLTGLSAAASAESGWVTLGLVGMAFQTGVAAFWILPGTLAAFLFNWWVIADRMRRRAADSHAVTLPDVLSFSALGSRLLRGLAALITLCMLGAYIAAQLTAAAKTFEATFGWNYSLGVGVGAGIVLLYTTLGGFRAVAWTDIVQAMLMIAAVSVLPFVLIQQLGGFSGMWRTLAAMPSGEMLTDAFSGRAGLALTGFFLLWLGIPLGYPGQPHVLVRFMAARDARSIRRAGIISTAWVCVLFSGAVLLGIAAHAYYGALAKPRVIFHFVLYAWAGLGAAFGPVLILRLLWPGLTEAGALAGMLTGFFSAIVWAETPVLKSVMYELPPAFLLAFVAAISVSLLTRRRR